MTPSNPRSFLLDTGIFIASERGDFDLKRFLTAHTQAHFSVSAVTAAELLEGVERATSAHRRKREAFVEDILASFATVDFSVPIARRWAQIAARLAKRGEPIGPLDMQIAATALHHGMTVVTFNTKHFNRVTGLVVIAPPTDAI